MARIVFSALVSGLLGKTGDIVFSKWKGIYYARRRVIPANPKSGDQCLQRYTLKVALQLWQSVKAWSKGPWDLWATGYALSGYNRFMDVCMGLLKTQFTAGGIGVDPTWSDPAVTCLTPFNKAYAALIDVQAATPATTKLTITWTARAGAASKNKVKPYYRLEDATAWETQAAVEETAATIDITGLVNDSQYEAALVPWDDDADVYGESAHQLATPAE